MTSLIDTIGHGPIRELRLARPPANALDLDLCHALRTALASAAADGIEGVVLSGSPHMFSAGMDVPWLLSLDDAARVRAAWEGFLDAARALASAPMPVAAAITGHAPAGGCVLALCCDYRVMAAGPYRIGLNETRAGLVAPEGIQRLMRRAVGARQAERLLVGGVLVDGAEALQLGLVDALAEPAEVSGHARAWLESVLAVPRSAMLGTRAIARADLVDALQPEHIDLDRYLASWDSPETRNALQSLLARAAR